MDSVIEAEGLTKRFGRTVALHGLDLVAERGQVLAVLGPNGAGKTTFVRLVATLLQPDEGTLRVGGYDVRRHAPAVRRIIGLAGQFAAVEPTMTGRENLEMVARLFGLGRRSARQQTTRVLETMGLQDAAGALYGATAAACAGDSISGPASSARRNCSSSTNPPRASIPAAAWNCGTPSQCWSPRAPTSC